MSELVVQKGGWPLDDRCTADVDFCHWADSVELKGARILHMGTGAHHTLGIHLGKHNLIVGLTISKEEIKAYLDLIEQRPSLMKSYHVEFLDIHSWNSMMFGDFDIINIPHFGEMPDPRRDAYGDSDLEFTLEKLLDSRSGPGALVSAYSGSSAWDRTYPVLSDVLGKPSFDFRSMMFWETRG